MQQHTVRGFTLVEVLVALMVMALMATMAWQGVDGMVRTRDGSQRQLDQTLRLQTVIAQWDQDLAALQETPAAPGIAFDGATLRITRRTPGGLQVVAWSLRPDPAGAAWQRWASPAVVTTAELQDLWLNSQQLLGNEPGQLTALTGLTQWQVYFYQGNAWSNAQSSANVAAAAAGAASAPPRAALPTGVRAVLSFSGGGGLTGTLTRDTQVGP
jgi:general secretion pathway protein J